MNSGLKVCDVELPILLHRMDGMDCRSLYLMANAAAGCTCKSCRVVTDHAQVLMQWQAVQIDELDVSNLGYHFATQFFGLGHGD